MLHSTSSANINRSQERREVLSHHNIESERIKPNNQKEISTKAMKVGAEPIRRRSTMSGRNSSNAAGNNPLPAVDTMETTPEPSSLSYQSVEIGQGGAATTIEEKEHDNDGHYDESDGDSFDYKHLCMPTNPWGKQKQEPQRFFEKDEQISILLATIMGLQHCFSMVGGLIAAPLVVFRFTVAANDPMLQQYAVAAALITSGITSIVNIYQLRIPFSKQIFGRQLYVGSGVLSVIGTSFTFVPIFNIGITDMMSNDGIDARTAYGKMLGTAMVCGMIEIMFSLAPPKYLKKIFPPIVSSITVMLLGISLIGFGMKQLGGGALCADMGWKEHVQARDEDIDPLPSPLCTSGNVVLGYGSPQFIGLAVSVMAFLVVIELFGSPFMRNCNVVLALCFGYLVAVLSSYEGESYINFDLIKNAPAFEFLWTETFPLGFYAPAVIPSLLASLVSTVETAGDITATYEASRLDVRSKEFTESLQGGLFSDSFCTILAGLFTSMPNTTYSQNNGVIRVTKCASKRAGYAAGAWLILLGVIGKLGGLIASIPDAVLGGMTIFLFSQIFLSGLSLASSLNLESRRVKFIMAMSMAIGVGVTVWPFAFQDRTASPYTANFWRCEDCDDVLKGVRNGVSIFLSTGYCIGSVVAMFLNALLPYGQEDKEFHDEENKKELEIQRLALQTETSSTSEESDDDISNDSNV